MSEHIFPSDDADFNTQFARIIEQFHKEHEADNDPEIESILEDALHIEIELNKQEPSDETLADCVDVLNSGLANVEVSDFPVLVTGRLRPILPRGVPLTQEKLPPALQALGTLQLDKYGPYIPVQNTKLICGKFDSVVRNSNRLNDEPGPEYVVILNLLVSQDADIQDGLGYILIEDIDKMTPAETVYESMADIAVDIYPELLDAIDTLPEKCGNDHKIIRALGKFRISIDWSKFPLKKPSQRQEFIGYLEDRLFDRVELDTELYTMTVRTMYYTEDNQGEMFPISVDDRKSINAHMEYPYFVQESIVGDVITYSVDLDMRASVGERGSDKCYSLSIPTQHICSIRNMRNDDLFTPDEQEGLALLDAHYTNSPVATPNFDAWNREAALGYDEDDELEEPLAPEEELAALDEGWREFFAEANEIVTKVYDSEKEAIAGRDRMYALTSDFMTNYPYSDEFEMQVEGPGMFYLPAYVSDSEEDVESDAPTVTLTIGGLSVTRGDIQTPMYGKFTGQSISSIEKIEDQPGKYAVRSLLVFKNTSPETPITFGTSLGVPLYSLKPERMFMVGVDQNITQLTLPEYERLKRCHEAIGSIALKFPDLDFLPWQLAELQEAIDTASDTEYTEVDIALLYTIGVSTRGDERVVQRTVDALGDILKERQVSCEGPAYTMDGGYTPHVHVQGMVANVISTNANINVEEPMLVIVTIEQDAWCMPLSTMEGFWC